MSTRHISLRPIREEDIPFLYRLYASTRADELARVDGEPAQKETFLRSQFAAQHEHYQRYFPNADFWIILAGSEPIGRYYVDQGVEEVRVIDIALLPEERNRGVGTQLMRGALRIAAELQAPARLRVQPHSDAVRLYERLGFVAIADEGVNLHMEWSQHAA